MEVLQDQLEFQLEVQLASFALTVFKFFLDYPLTHYILLWPYSTLIFFSG